MKKEIIEPKTENEAFYGISEVQVFMDESGSLAGVPTKEIQEAETGNRNQRRSKWAKLRKKYKI